MKTPRGLSVEEGEAWAKVAATVAPIRPQGAIPARPATAVSPPISQRTDAPPPARVPTASPGRPAPPNRVAPAPKVRLDPGLDSHWDRRFRAGAIEPDFTLDLHGHTLDSAHSRLIDGVAQARAMGARVVLLIAGKSRPAEAADRAGKRGAIRAKVLDWLASSSHAPAIAAIRKAHPRHGGEGALYLVLRRGR